MSTGELISEKSTTRESTRNFTLVAAFSLLPTLIVTFQNFGLVANNASSRLGLKVIAFFLIFVFSARYPKVTLGRFIIFMPMAYLSLRNAATIPYTVDEMLLQTLNPLFFLPLLFANYSFINFEKVAERLLLIIVPVMCVEFFFPADIFENGGFTGGLGNPSSLGFFLIISSILIRNIILKLLLCILVFLTGALMPSIISMFIISIMMLAKIRSVKSLIALTGFGLLIMVGFGAVSDEALPSVSHLLAKASSLTEFGANSGAASIDLRWQYYTEGFTLIFDNPTILLVGTVGQGITPLTQEPIFTGDGFLIAAIVTYGLPFFIIFFGSLSVIVLKECSTRDSSRKIAGKVLLVYFISFLTNRMLDYWPMALLFCVFLAIGVDSLGKSLGRLQSEHSQPSAAGRSSPMS